MAILPALADSITDAPRMTGYRQSIFVSININKLLLTFQASKLNYVNEINLPCTIRMKTWTENNQKNKREDDGVELFSLKVYLC